MILFSQTKNPPVLCAVRAGWGIPRGRHAHGVPLSLSELAGQVGAVGSRSTARLHPGSVECGRTVSGASSNCRSLQVRERHLQMRQTSLQTQTNRDTSVCLFVCLFVRYVCQGRPSYWWTKRDAS